MNKNQNNSRPSSNGTSFSELFQDVFGLQAWEEQKESHNSHRAVPWQWLLWGGLFFFCLGFSFSSESPWILLVALAAAVIVFLARSTETIEPQVFLLTDDRSEEQKKAYQKKSQMKSSHFAKAMPHDDDARDDRAESDVEPEATSERTIKDRYGRIRHTHRKERFHPKDREQHQSQEEVTETQETDAHENFELPPRNRKPRARHLRRTPRTFAHKTPRVPTRKETVQKEVNSPEVTEKPESVNTTPPIQEAVQPPKVFKEDVDKRTDTPETRTEPKAEIGEQPPKSA